MIKMVKRLLTEGEIEDKIRKNLRFLVDGTISNCKGVEDDWSPDVYWRETKVTCDISPKNAPAVKNKLEFKETRGELAPNTFKIYFEERE